MKKIKSYISKFIKIIRKPEMAILPGQLAFFFVLSVVPIVTLITYIASFFNLSMTFISDFFAKAFSQEIVDLISPILKTGAKIDFQFFVFLIAAFYIASNGAMSIINASNTIYGINSDNAIKKRIKAMIMTFIIVALLLFILVVPVFGNKIVELLEYVNMNETVTARIISILRILKSPVSWFIIFIFIKIIYTMAPERKVPSAYVNYGALFTTVFWGISTIVYSYYITQYAANYKFVYAGLSNIVILMLWLYILTTIFVWGMAINSNMEKEIELAKTSQINKVK